MHPAAKDLVALARQLGFSSPTPTGSGHYRMEHPNGFVIIPATPSDHRGRANSIAQMERISGKRLERVNARRSRKAVKPSGFSVDRAKREQAKFHRENPSASVSATPKRSKAKEVREQLDFLIGDLIRLWHDIEAVRDYEVDSAAHRLHNELAIRIVDREQEIAGVVYSHPKLAKRALESLSRDYS